MKWKEVAECVEGRVRLFTFQSFDVALSVLQRDYYAVPELSREQRDYSKDIAQLGGYYPVWAFSSYPVATKIPNRVSPEDLANGDVLRRMRDEMSLTEDEGLEEFICIEFELDTSEVFIGKTHNCCDMAVVCSHIPMDSLCATYRLSYPNHWYYPTVSVIDTYVSDPCFTGTFVCSKQPRR